MGRVGLARQVRGRPRNPSVLQRLGRFLRPLARHHNRFGIENLLGLLSRIPITFHCNAGAYAIEADIGFQRGQDALTDFLLDSALVFELLVGEAVAVRPRVGQHTAIRVNHDDFLGLQPLDRAGHKKGDRIHLLLTQRLAAAKLQDD